MKQEDKLYEEWLSELKNKQPILKNPEELTTSILNSIPRSHPKTGRRKFLIGAWLSGLAAAMLLLLFINDTYLSPIPQQNGYGDWQTALHSHYRRIGKRWEFRRKTIICPLDSRDSGNSDRHVLSS